MQAFIKTKKHMNTSNTLTVNIQPLVSRRMLRERAVELAAIDGRAPQDASKVDWDQAKLELMGEPVTQESITPGDSSDEPDQPFQTDQALWRPSNF